MAEYRDLIGIMALAKDLVRRMPSSYYNGMVMFLREIIKLPAADVAPVVRCKDCKIQQYCKVAQYLGADGFCSNGEKEGGSNG